MAETFVISVGGSLIIPNELDVGFLREFRDLILRHVSQGKRFVLVPGGGSICREYQKAARKITAVPDDFMDTLGIYSTRFNASLLMALFHDIAHPEIIAPDNIPKSNKSVIIGAGWKPGNSTDYVAVRLAKPFGSATVINLSDVDYIYDKDPDFHKDARPFERLSWKQFKDFCGGEWKPGSNVPFDPVASKEAEKQKIRVIIARGSNIRNTDNILSGKPFIGTVIE